MRAARGCGARAARAVRRGLPLLALALVLVLGAAACWSDDEAETAIAAPESLDPPAPTEVDDSAVAAPLTGLPLDDEEALGRPVVAVKVDNAGPARPQTGLEDADIVFTALVEGGATRFLALYHSVAPDVVGPVRSSREPDAELLPSFEPVFAHSGAAAPVLSLLREAGLLLREEGQPAAAWTRDPGRRAPHNLYLSPAELLAGDDLVPAARPWTIGEAAGEAHAGEDVDEVALRYSSGHEAGWAWDAGAGRWLRGQDGEPHLAAGGDRIAATNVVVARVEVRDAGRTDAAGNPVVDMTLEGAGEALVLMGGRAVEARWVREPGGHFSWQTAGGEPLELLPGRAWVELVPASGGVEIGPQR